MNESSAEIRQYKPVFNEGNILFKGMDPTEQISLLINYVYGRGEENFKLTSYLKKNSDKVFNVDTNFPPNLSILKEIIKKNREINFVPKTQGGAIPIRIFFEEDGVQITSGGEETVSLQGVFDWMINPINQIFQVTACDTGYKISIRTSAPDQ